MASTCQKCGKANEGGARYCSACGFDMSTGLTLQTPVSEPTVTMAQPPKTTDPFLGAKIGGCVIQSKIGQGGMGAVYRGMQTSLERPVAIKILPSHLAQNTSYITRFLRESKIVASIRHPNIVSVYDRGNQDEIYFFVMEFIQGRTIGDVLAEKKAMQPGDALEITRQAALALSAAAAKNIIHRDIKPDNIMIDEGGLVKVTDFGLVKNTADTTGGITATHQVMGTPAFMSPEQCKGDPADHRSDMYSLGMTLYSMLTGRPAFTAETTHGLLMKQITEQPVPPHSANPNVPESVWLVLSRMLDKNPENRYPDWPQFIQALDQLKSANPDDYIISGVLQRSSAGGYQRISGAATTPSPMSGTSPLSTPVPTPSDQLTFDLEKATPAPGDVTRPPTQPLPGGGGKGVIIGIGIGAAVALLAVVIILLLPRQDDNRQSEKPETGTTIVKPPVTASTGAGEQDRSAEIASLSDDIISDLELGDLSKASEKMNRLRRRFGGIKHPAAAAAFRRAEKLFREAEPAWRKLHKARSESKRLENAGNFAAARNLLLESLKGVNDPRMRGKITPLVEAVEREMQSFYQAAITRAQGFMNTSKWDPAIENWEQAKKYAVSAAELNRCKRGIEKAKQEKSAAESTREQKEKFEKLLSSTREAYAKRDIEIAEKGIAGLEKLRPGNKMVGELAELIRLEKTAPVPAGISTVDGKKKLTPAFSIGLYEVTNRQFGKFIDAGGYTNREYWPGLAWIWKTKIGITLPQYWNDSRFNKPDQPVVGVSFYEASAYCKWLSRISGKRYRLPRMPEWKRAAEGPKGARWPWGNSAERPPANLRDAGPKSTTPVGKFDKGKSAFGCFDIIGNAAEWCTFGLKCHAVGGSWLTYLDDINVDSDRPITATRRLSQVGFRVLREGK